MSCPPQARREKPRVSAFTSANIEKILALMPDLVLTFSDLQADIVADLIRRGLDANPADAPFGKAVGLRRQRVKVGPVEFFEQRPAGDTEAPDRAFVVELPQTIVDDGDRCPT